MHSHQLPCRAATAERQRHHHRLRGARGARLVLWLIPVAHFRRTSAASTATVVCEHETSALFASSAAVPLPVSPLAPWPLHALPAPRPSALLSRTPDACPTPPDPFCSAAGPGHRRHGDHEPRLQARHPAAAHDSLPGVGVVRRGAQRQDLHRQPLGAPHQGGVEANGSDSSTRWW